MNDLVTLAGDVRAYASTLEDPATAPPGLQSALSAVRTFAVVPGNPGAPAPNLDLLAPSAGVPRPAGSDQAQAVDVGALPAPAVSLPFAAPGPPGDPGPQGDPGPRGPIGPGVDPARVAALEAALLELQEASLADTILRIGGKAI